MAWLLRLASNVVNDYYRAQASRPAAAPAFAEDAKDVRDAGDARDAEMSGGDVLPIILARENMRELSEAINSLPNEQREPLLMKALHGMKFKEIAQTLGVAQTTVQSRVKAGILRLKQFMDDTSGDRSPEKGEKDAR